ncbi:DUF4167 domain-containing protein [Rhizobium sp. LCM 4573]|uniref:DUF4167 domain-containing protein n=1 Tax=Rhizobium sp. LCM 4573 TaxID=1848291 RepID=UPI0008D91D90|nr:DUF4167 domain-containing protein [Rhizobium sp. LCM 4573]OHV82012.1 hypothetical protein LCM4573_18555 [Rhizobium sp. LCM 4573]
MRPGQQNKRGRGRGNNNGGGGGGNNNNFNRKGGNPLTRTYDSSGPDLKIRGTAQHIAEKYSALARDAQSSGDRVMAENYLQHAEHYNRIIAAAQAQMQERFQRDDRHDYNDRDGNLADQDELDTAEAEDGGSPQPVIAEAQSEQPQEQRPEQRNEPRNEQRSREGRRDQQPRRERRPEPAPVAEAAVDGSGPQPVIEGTPAEVAVEEEEQAEAAPRRRRNAGNRARRPRRGEAGGEEAAAGSDEPGEAPQPPVLAAVASE